MTKPTLIYHADWGSEPSKRWCAKAILGSDGRYVASAPTLVGNLPELLGNLKVETGKSGTVFAGFDFPIGVTVTAVVRDESSPVPTRLSTGHFPVRKPKLP